MSYCRWGKDSDVYVYVTERVVKGEHETWWCCHDCRLFSEEPIYAPTLKALKAHLEAHVGQGHKVPDDAFERIDQEIAEGNE